MNVAQSILYLYPNADPLNDFRVQDDSDGNGPYIAYWDEKAIGAPKPTPEELQAAWDSIQPTPADLLAAAQTAKKDAVSAAVGAKITAGYQSIVVLASTGKAHQYGTTLEDQQNMHATRYHSDLNPTEIADYRPQDELRRVDHTHEEFVLISDAVFNRVNYFLDQGYAYYQQIFGPGATIDSVNAITVDIKDDLPAIPSGLSGTMGTAGNGQVVLNWDANMDDSMTKNGSYNVYVDGSAAPVNTSPITETTFMVTGLVTGDHTFQIAAFGANGKESPKSDAITVTVT